MKRIINGLLVAINIILALFLLSSYISVYINPSWLSYVPFIGLAYPLWLFANVLFLLIWLFKWKKSFFISFFTLLIGINIHLDYFAFNRSSEDTGAIDGIKILSYNIGQLSPKLSQNNSFTPEMFYDFLQLEEPDIICLQEANWMTPKRYNLLEKDYPHIFWPKNEFTNNKTGVMILSKYPFVYGGKFLFEKSLNTSIFADIAILGDTLRVYNCHLQSNQFSNKSYELLNRGLPPSNDSEIESFKDMLRRMRQGYKSRSQQVDTISNEIKNCRLPLIVAGDFNDTPISYAYHKISDDLTDSFLESGSGIGNTYNGRFPVFRIDYILHSKKLVSRNFKIHKIEFSDHYPVSATIGKNRTD